MFMDRVKNEALGAYLLVHGVASLACGVWLLAAQRLVIAGERPDLPAHTTTPCALILCALGLLMPMVQWYYVACVWHGTSRSARIIRCCAAVAIVLGVACALHFLLAMILNVVGYPASGAHGNVRLMAWYFVATAVLTANNIVSLLLTFVFAVPSNRRPNSSLYDEV